MMSTLNRSKSYPAKLLLILFGLVVSLGAAADTDLADSPIGSKIVVPANVILDLSVEFPTAVSDAYLNQAYTPAAEFNGYFNPNFCYDYVTGSAYTGATVQFGIMVGYFAPVGASPTTHACSGHWSGNFLNWVLTQTIDPLRKALTGGARIVDTPDVTILQKAYQDNQGGGDNQNVKSLGTNALVKEATPFTNWSTIYVNNLHTGLNFVFSQTGIDSSITTGTNFVGVNYSDSNDCTDNANCAANNTTYQVQSAVQVCSGIDAGSDLETDGGRCRAYAGKYKPVGLMQKYAAENTGQVDSIRYSAFGYLNDPSGSGDNERMDGGVMRARMKSVGPYMANPGTTPALNTYNATTNPYGGAEWRAQDGTFVANPNPTDSAATIDPAGAVGNSGVINYLNKFGFSVAAANPTGDVSAYKRYDSVSELYYAATRYYRNLGNVPSYTTNPATASGEATNDNFPVITAWDDPVKYSCANNYIVGIGDIHTWNDANVPGDTVVGGAEPTKPAEVASDTAVDARTATNFIANLENIAGYTGNGDGTQNNGNDYQVIATLGDNLIGNIATPSGGWCCSNTNTFYMAGLAYDVHTRDIRPDITTKSGIVTVSTFWLDVMEGNDYHEKNQFWMTAKYGGFDTSNKTAFPGGYSEYGQTAALPTASWNSSYLAGNVTTGYRDDRGNLAPDQYFQARSPAAMASGLDSAFKKIASNVPVGVSAALSLSSSTLNASGNANYVTSYAKDWSGDMVAQTLTPTNTNGLITTTATQIWDAHNWLPPTTTSTAGLPAGITPLTYDTRVIGTSSALGAGHGVAFRMSGISASQKTTLGSSSTAQTDVLNYLRGDQSNESSTGFRPRAYVLGDITNSQPAVVGTPSFPYADAPLNPGYAAFVAAHSAPDRRTVVYIGANDGMLHAFDGTISTTGGKELFAYVPSYLFNTNLDANNNPVGLASLTINPLQHHFLVDAQPVVYDVDFDWTSTGGVATNPGTTTDWHTIVISGLGKGGKGFFALDVTDPDAITSEADLIGPTGKVLWEIDTSSADFAHMGYSYGKPQIAKTAKYGWTLFLTSGYDNDDGQGYIYLVNPKDGTLYERIATNVGDTTNPAGLAQVNAFIPSAADFTADSLYAGDLLGNVWRVDLTSTSTLSLHKLATLTDSGGAAQPVTTQPDFGVDSTTLTRYVFFGTGRLLADTDLVSPHQQSFYAIQDGTNAAFSPSNTTLTRTDLVNHSSIAALTGATTAGVVIPASGPSKKYGFYIDLPTYAASPGLQASDERINVNPIASGGAVAFASNLFGRDVCGKGSSHIFAMSYTSTLDSDGNPVIGNSFLQINSAAAAYLSYATGIVTNIALVSSAPTTSGPPGEGGGMSVLAGLDTSSAGNASSTAGGGKLNNVTSSLVRLNWREVPSSN
jgi:type IV pilus assembly protein PilY1